MNKITENSTKVLEDDFQKYMKEMEIGISCIDEMYDSFLNGDLEDVLLCIKDLEDAIYSLQILFEKKERMDKLVKLVDDFKKRGINIDFVSRKIKKEAESAGTLTATTN